MRASTASSLPYVTIWACASALRLSFITSALCLGLVTLAPADEYVLGPGDILKVIVWGHEDLSKDYPVERDGFVSFPLVGRLEAGGQTPRQFAARLTELLERDYLVNPQVLVSVKEYLSRKVHVLGEAERPGVFYLIGKTTLVDILSKAGGLSKSAGKQLIVVRASRSAAAGAGSGNAMLRVRLEKIEAGDAAENIQLEDGDTIFIPRALAFFVLGEVKNPGTVPLDREITALEAVSLAGGFTDRAAPAGVKLIRRGSGGTPDTVFLNLAGAVPGDSAVKIQDGDTVLVPKGNAFFVLGEVRKPGSYQLDKETNILEGITIAGGFTERAAPSRTRVIRSTASGQQILTIDINDIVKRGRGGKAIPLLENDVVVVPESFF